MKKLLALLLALAMVFSLAACASKKDDDDDDDDDEKTEETAKPADDDDDEDEDVVVETKFDYKVFLQAMNDFIEAPTMSKLCYFEGGTLAGDELYDFLKFFIGVIGASEDDYLANVTGQIPEGLTIEEKGAEELSASELDDVQSELDKTHESLEKVEDYLEDLIENGSDEQWESEAAGLNMTVDEAKEIMPEYLDLISALCDAVDGDVTEGFAVTIDRSNGTSDTYNVCCTKDGRWFTELLITALSGLADIV